MSTDMSSPSTLRVQIADKIARVTLARPELRNAFNAAMIAELTHTFDALGRDPDVRAIVLAADGPAFCAGADLNWMREMAGYTREQNLADASRLAQMLKVMDHCPKPVLAEVQGDVYAGGLGLLAVCDLVIVASQAQFCLSEVRIGLIPATISPYVIRAIGTRAARRYFLTAERFSAQEAMRIGLAHEVVEASELALRTQALLAGLLANSPQAVMDAKRLVREVANQTIDDKLIADTVNRIADSRASEQGREGVQAFLDKRKPGWLS